MAHGPYSDKNDGLVAQYWQKLVKKVVVFKAVGDRVPFLRDGNAHVHLDDPRGIEHVDHFVRAMHFSLNSQFLDFYVGYIYYFEILRTIRQAYRSIAITLIFISTLFALTTSCLNDMCVTVMNISNR